MYNIRERLFFIFHSLGLMAAHIHPKKTLNLIPHMPTTTTTTTTTTTSTTTTTTTPTPKFKFFKKIDGPTDMRTYTSR